MADSVEDTATCRLEVSAEAQRLAGEFKKEPKLQGVAEWHCFVRSPFARQFLLTLSFSRIPGWFQPTPGHDGKAFEPTQGCEPQGCDCECKGALV